MVLCCAVAIGHAQVLNIVDSESGDKLDQVSLMNKTPNTFATTNAKGMVDITPFKGAERIEVIYLGYEKQVFSYQELIGLNDTLKLLRLSFSTDAIVVSSSRWKQNVRDIPFKVTAISHRNDPIFENISLLGILTQLISLYFKLQQVYNMLD